MKEPTQEQIKEFWEWCGLRYEKDQDVFKVILPSGEWYNFGADWKMGEVEPLIDLNNLFKYAVPKLRTHPRYRILDEIHLYPSDDGWLCELDMVLTEYDEYVPEKCKVEHAGYYQDPALALFWAIWEVIKK